MYRRKARLPHFATLDQLVPGAAFNPYRLFQPWSVVKAIAGAPKLRPGAKFMWLVLADQCFSSGYDMKSQASQAAYMGLSVDQIQYHLAHLVKAKLVHVEPCLGRQNYVWLLYQPLFAFCSPLTHRKTPVRGAGEFRQGVPENSGTHNLYSESLISIPGVPELLPTSRSSGVAGNGRRKGENPAVPENPKPDFRERRDGQPAFAPNGGELERILSGVTARAARVAPTKQLSQAWKRWTPHDRQRRFEQACRIHGRILDFEQHLKNPHHDIARQARHEINRSMAELAELGFYLTRDKET
jgi:hypothetical protein